MKKIFIFVFIFITSIISLHSKDEPKNVKYEIEYEQKVVDLSISGGLTGALISKIWLRVCD